MVPWWLRDASPIPCRSILFKDLTLSRRGYPAAAGEASGPPDTKAAQLRVKTPAARPFVISGSKSGCSRRPAACLVRRGRGPGVRPVLRSIPVPVARERQAGCLNKFFAGPGCGCPQCRSLPGRHTAAGLVHGGPGFRGGAGPGAAVRDSPVCAGPGAAVAEPPVPRPVSRCLYPGRVSHGRRNGSGPADLGLSVPEVCRLGVAALSWSAPGSDPAVRFQELRRAGTWLFRLRESPA